MKTLYRNIIFLSSLLVVLFIMLPVLNYEDLSYTGYEILLGKELIDINPFGFGSIASAHLPFSYWALFAYLLPLLGGIIILIDKRASLVSAVLLLAGFFLLITLPDRIEIVYIIAGSENTAEIDWTIGIGLIGSLISAAVGTVMTILISLGK